MSHGEQGLPIIEYYVRLWSNVVLALSALGQGDYSRSRTQRSLHPAKATRKRAVQHHPNNAVLTETLEVNWLRTNYCEGAGTAGQREKKGQLRRNEDDQ